MKTKKYKLLWFILPFLSLSFVVQQNGIQKVIDAFSAFESQNVQEKVYLHTDKPYYAVGDDIWFKAYVLQAKNLQATNQSNLLYAELLNSKNHLIKRLRLALVAGTGWGNFNLPDTLKEGTYRIRAYTNLMRNFDKSLYYDYAFKIGDIRSSQVLVSTSYSINNAGQITTIINYKNIDGRAYANNEVIYQLQQDGKDIQKGKAKTNSEGNLEIITDATKTKSTQAVYINTSLKIAENTNITKTIALNKLNNQYSLQFFPEGGNIIEGVRNKIGFKALQSNGLSKDVEGVIVNSKNESVAKLLSKHKGMGFFFLNALPNEVYTAVITDKSGEEKRFELPALVQKGISLNVGFIGKDTIGIKVLANSNYLQENIGKKFYILTQSGGNLINYSIAELTETGGFYLKQARSVLPLGISQIQLVNENFEPLAERKIFNYAADDFLKIEVKTNQQTSYKPRQKVDLEISVHDKNDKPVLGSFSVAVIDETAVPIKEDEENSIYASLLLQSDLKGYIEEPNYYFNNVTDKKIEELDVLMLTQGWTRYQTSDILASKFPQIIYPAEKNLTIKGKVLNNKKPVPNANLILFGAKISDLLQVKANALGEFVADSMFFTDSTKFVIQARSEKGKKFVEIVMDEGVAEDKITPFSSSLLSENISSSMTAYLKNSKTQYEEFLKYGLASRTIFLDEVKVTEKAKRIENSQNLNGGGNANAVISGEDLLNVPTLEFALQGKVAGLTFQNGQAYFSRFSTSGGPAQIVLDGMYVEPEFLSSINPADVETVEVLKDISYTAVYGSYGANGVIVITTKRGGGGGFSNTYSPGIISFMPLGIYQAKEFFVPNYEVKDESHNMKDNRSTIFWKPNVISEKEGKTKVSYFVSDNIGTHRVLIEGADLKGNIGRQIVRYTVK